MNEYDIEAAFSAIEEELIASMMRNMGKHIEWENDEGFRWTMWQTEQLKSLEKYKRENKKKFERRFNEINGSIKMLVEQARQTGAMDQETAILEAIEEGWKFPKIQMEAGEVSAAFFSLNTRKLNALVKATENDFKKAETAMLRMAEDQYRQVIFNAQVYANSGAGTYEKAVDMATRDFLSRGINCIEYANGTRHRMKDYAMMAIRTASKRAYLTGEGEKRQEWGITTVIMNKRGNPCPKCLPFVGKILIDDVWSGGSAEDGPYPLMSNAVAAGLYHPNCKDSHSTYFPGITSNAGNKFTEEEIEEIEQDYSLEQKKNVAKRNYEKYSQLEELSLDEENKTKYAARKGEWNQEYHEINKTVVDKSEQSTDIEDLKRDIANKRAKKSLLDTRKEELEQKEKKLTQKVYFESGGTQKDIDELQEVLTSRKETEKQVEKLENLIREKQDIYRIAAEKRLVSNGVIKEVKLINKMTPEAVDRLESTLVHLKERYGIMPEGVVFNPSKTGGSAATYNWLEDKIYISNQLADPDKYLDRIHKAEQSHKEYERHYNIKKTAEERIEKAEEILSDKNIKGHEREKARLEKANAEIEFNISRAAVRENMEDVIIHEYGHFIHRHADVDYIQKKNVFGAKELGGKMVNGDWRYEINTAYSRTKKVEAAKISKYATEDPYETFAEGFLAIHKGEKIPEHVEKVVHDAMEKAEVKYHANTINKYFSKSVVKSKDSDIIISGARIIDPDGDAGIKFAEMYYSEIRSFSTDVEKIAKNIERSEKDIKQIKEYLFESEFDPDCAIAQSWQRLMNGKDIKPHDKTLIEHELLEMKIKREDPGIEHWKAHEIATKKYNYQREAAEYYGNLKKYK